MNPDRPFREVVDDAVNQTLTRSINIAFIVSSFYLPHIAWGLKLWKYLRFCPDHWIHPGL